MKNDINFGQFSWFFFEIWEQITLKINCFLSILQNIHPLKNLSTRGSNKGCE
jgi:hypothetical protein